VPKLKALAFVPAVKAGLFHKTTQYF